MIKLPNVTLVCVSSVEIETSIKSLMSTSQFFEFSHIKFITDCEVDVDPKIEVVKCEKINSLVEYSKFIIYDLHKHIDTDLCMIVQYDSYVSHPELWSNDFLNYDYIGAPWPTPGTLWMPKHKYMNSDGDVLDEQSEKYRVGNGGFSIRSKRLLTTPLRINTPFEDRVSPKGYFFTKNEDWQICIYNRHLYEQDGNVFAPYEIANIFSKEWAVHDTFAKHR
jgi:hypothetical protein